MLDRRKKWSRLGIYFFYDREGVVDEYVAHFLKNLMPHFEKLVVVVNGKLTADGLAVFESTVTGPVLVRDNIGFDVWAYKAGIEMIGWPELETYDEIVMLNFTIMGPTRPFSEMFSEMEMRELDFWGVTVHHGADLDPWGLMPDGYIPLHIQSHFIAVRQRMVRSPTFQGYWRTLGPIATYEEAIAKHEALFTQRFENAGFRWSVYVDTTDLVGKLFYPLFNVPVELIENRRAPIFKRKLFFSDAPTFLDENANQVARQLLDYLRVSGRFDTRMILEHVVRSANLHDIRQALNLDRVVIGLEPTQADLRIAVYLEARVPNLEDTIARVRRAVPTADVYVLRELGSYSEQVLIGDVEVVSHDEPWTFLAAAEHAVPYDAAAYVGTSTPLVKFPESIQDARVEQMLEAMFSSPSYVNAIVQQLSGDSFVGLVYPPPPIHAAHFGLLAHGWGSAFSVVNEALREAGITVPRSPTVPPGYPESGSLWWRPDALKGLRELNEAMMSTRYESAPPDSDESAQAFRIVLPFVAQHAGYLSHVVMPPALAENRLVSLTHYLERVAAVWSHPGGERFSAIDHRFGVRGLASPFTTGGLQSRVYFDSGNGFSEVDSVAKTLAATSVSGDFKASVHVPKGTIAVRFDPLEDSACVISGISAGSRKIRPINGVRKGAQDYFGNVDPQYEVMGSWVRGGTLEITVARVSPIGTSDWQQPVTLSRVSLGARVRRFLRRLTSRGKARAAGRPGVLAPPK